MGKDKERFRESIDISEPINETPQPKSGVAGGCVVSRTPSDRLRADGADGHEAEGLDGLTKRGAEPKFLLGHLATLQLEVVRERNVEGPIRDPVSAEKDVHGAVVARHEPTVAISGIGLFPFEREDRSGVGLNRPCPLDKVSPDPDLLVGLLRHDCDRAVVYTLVEGRH